MKWFKHIDVVRCFCGTFAMLVCHGGAFTAAEEARPPGDKTTTEQKREHLLARRRARNLKWMPMFALHRAAIRPQMSRLMLGLHARRPRALLKRRGRQKRERHLLSSRQGGAWNFLAFQTQSITHPSSKVLAAGDYIKLLRHVEKFRILPKSASLFVAWQQNLTGPVDPFTESWCLCRFFIHVWQKSEFMTAVGGVSVPALTCYVADKGSCLGSSFCPRQGFSRVWQFPLWLAAASWLLYDSILSQTHSVRGDSREHDIRT